MHNITNKIIDDTSSGLVVPAPEVRASTTQICGLYPFLTGVETPTIGVPIGRDLFTGATVCSDPVSWFSKAKLIANPSLLVTGRPGLGKSSLVRRMATGLSAYGVTPLVFGDLKPDYKNLIKNLGGNIIELGRARGSLNILDPGSTRKQADRLTGEARQHLISDIEGRRLTTLAALLTLNRANKVTDHEEAILATALQALDTKHNEPTLYNLIDLLSAPTEAVESITLSKGDTEKYFESVNPLLRSIAALTQGAIGDLFAKPTTTPIDLTKPVCINVSGISESDEKLQAAVLLACWSEGFGSIAALQALSDAQLEPQQNFVVILDELWRVLRTGEAMADRIDSLTRLDRSTGVGTIMVTHTLKDLTNNKTSGFAERMGYFAMTGVPQAEINGIRELVNLSNAEAKLLTSWSTPETWNQQKLAHPPGLGKILFKIGGRPGLATQTVLTQSEQKIHDTNTRW